MIHNGTWEHVDQGRFSKWTSNFMDWSSESTIVDSINVFECVFGYPRLSAQKCTFTFIAILYLKKELRYKIGTSLRPLYLGLRVYRFKWNWNIRWATVSLKNRWRLLSFAIYRWGVCPLHRGQKLVVQLRRKLCTLPICRTSEHIVALCVFS